MKTIKYLEKKIKELEEIANRNMDDHACSFDKGLIYHKERYYEIKARLQSLKNVLKLIDEYIKEIQEIYDSSDDKELVKPIYDGKVFTLMELKNRMEGSA